MNMPLMGMDNQVMTSYSNPYDERPPCFPAGQGSQQTQDIADQPNSMENELINLQKKIMDLESKLNYGNNKSLLDTD